jgi:hypothetical protein
MTRAGLLDPALSANTRTRLVTGSQRSAERHTWGDGLAMFVVAGVRFRVVEPDECDDVERLIRDLRAAERWQPKVRTAPLGDEDRETVHARIAELFDERCACGAKHAGHIRKTARFLGREVAAHRVTLADAERHLDALCMALDPETPVAVALVPFREAKEIAESAFRRSFEGVGRG